MIKLCCKTYLLRAFPFTAQRYNYFLICTNKFVFFLKKVS